MNKIVSSSGTGQDDLLDVVLAASRGLVAISAQSIASVEDDVDLVQFRILVVIASSRACSLNDVAAAVNLHVSTASRTCDRLVGAELVHRGANATDRRNLELTLTHRGEALVGRALRHRRAALADILDRLSPRKQRRLAAAMRDLAVAAGEPSDRALWAMGWTTEPDPSAAGGDARKAGHA
jgi:DNA-binding MarR family transcriptional regulator